MDCLTLKGRGGVTLTLFAPREVPGGGLEAHAFVTSGPLPRPRTLTAPNKKRYHVPAVPEPVFMLAHVVLPEAT